MYLNVVTLNIPYPPDYGGMIDSFYRLKWLKAEGVRIHLHCFEYGRQSSGELESVCETVKYYPREATIQNHFSKIPYIVKSRRTDELLRNLKTNDFPILFDGLHTTFFINHPDLAVRRKFLRAHNVEHLYYKSLTEIENNLLKKLYYRIESLKLKNYEDDISSSVNLFTISESDFNFFSRCNKNVYLAPPFHPFEELSCKSGKGDYILYHGDLSVPENIMTASSLIKNVFSKIKQRCIIAGKNPPVSLLKQSERAKNLELIATPEKAEMEEMIKNAHINILPALTSNGFKMKLLISLYSGRHCLVNRIAAQNLNNESLFHIADSETEFIDKINFLMKEEFTDKMIQERKYLLEEKYSNRKNARKIIDLIFR